MQRLQPMQEGGLNTANLDPPKIVQCAPSSKLWKATIQRQLINPVFHLNTSSASYQMSSKKAADNPDVCLKHRDVDVCVKVCPLLNDREDAAEF